MSKSKAPSITADALDNHGACWYAVELFRKRYGESATLSKANIAAFLRSNGYLAQRAPDWLRGFLNTRNEAAYDKFLDGGGYNAPRRERTRKILALLRTQAKLS